MRRALLGAVACLAACGGEVRGDDVNDVDMAREELRASCARHADCASETCDVHRGRCVREAELVYVDRRDVACATGDGSKSRPVCTIGEGIARTTAERSAVRVRPGQYFPFHVSDRAVSLYGPAGEDGDAEVTEEDVGGSRVGANATVLVDGFNLGRHSRFGIECAGGALTTSLTVRRSQTMSDVGVGMRVTGCVVRVDRTRMSGLYGAIQYTDARYVVTNTVVTGVSERTAIVVRGGAGRFELVTVVNNGDPALAHAGAFDCGTTPVRIEDSIVFGNLHGAGGSQLTGACRLERVVVGTHDGTTARGAIRLDPELAGYTLPRTPANLACCIDRAASSPVRTDFDGTPRPQGPAFDIGAYEAPE
jgi:hypothetical protein